MFTTVASYWRKIQGSLFPGFAEELGVTTDKHLKVILVLDIIKLEDHLDIDPYPMGPGRPRLDATAMGRAFVAKAVLNIPTTRALIDWGAELGRPTRTRLVQDPVPAFVALLREVENGRVFWYEKGLLISNPSAFDADISL